MPSLFITGYGIEQATLKTDDLVQRLMECAYDSLDDKPQEVKLSAAIAPYIAREDRAMLTSQTICCLNVGFSAMKMAEKIVGFTLAEKEAMCVYTTYETVRDFHEVVWQFKTSSEQYTERAFLLKSLGVMANAVHPLRLFRKLPTNGLYHLSKLFGLRGGGYPLRKMSLGGLSLLEEAFYNLPCSGSSGALISAFGDMSKADNAQVFRKMGLIDVRNASRSNVQGTGGAVSLIVETPERISRQEAQPLAEVLQAFSRFSTSMFATRQDWIEAYGLLEPWVRESHPVVVLYDNGAPGIGDAEVQALESSLISFEIRRYKPWSKYAVATSGLVDLVCALADPTIEPGRVVIIHGEGASMGLGLIVLRKSGRSSPQSERTQS
ncbi:hypothetical protein [Pseudomonas brassicacearum]|uniref:Beta-ketoacyl-[acyl-carrier-protein] synthase III C-terminal domain-containing protein n=1 Tax=Pseudomonas brassicacearum TaxID=930166 RepID=A0A423GIQ6_9PSED|nr:hypothetical protein [Pseudomonas brassicacearum]ROM89587.1 hypothetical protein BK658_28035 [Pseudomonas brassicacearum]